MLLSALQNNVVPGNSHGYSFQPVRRPSWGVVYVQSVQEVPLILNIVISEYQSSPSIVFSQNTLTTSPITLIINAASYSTLAMRSNTLVYTNIEGFGVSYHSGNDL